MKAAKRREIINEVRYLRGVEPIVAESGLVVAYEVTQALKRGEKVLVPRPRLNRTHQLHLLNGTIVYGIVRPGRRAPLTIAIDEMTDELALAPYESA